MDVVNLFSSSRKTNTSAMVGLAMANVASYELQAARFINKDDIKVSVFFTQTTPPYCTVHVQRIV